MKANELSVGNYVFATETEGSDDQPCGMVTRYPIQIETIYGDTILDNYGMERDIEQLEPIPITPEILLQSGFETDGDKYFIDYELYYFEIFEYSDSIWLVTYDDCEFDTTSEEVSVSYIHDLQRLLVLFAVPKEINIKLD